jgi:23S rRNA-/tRNA-specific pseudouridylate synthase
LLRLSLLQLEMMQAVLFDDTHLLAPDKPAKTLAHSPEKRGKEEASQVIVQTRHEASDERNPLSR